MFESNVNAPTGVSYAPPIVNFSSLGDLLNSFTEGAKNRQQYDLTQNLKTLPTDPSGGTDYNKLSQTYMQGGQPAAGIALANLGLARQQQAAAPGLISQALGQGLPGAPASAAGPAAGPQDYYAKLAQQESGGNPAAVSTAPGSHATGTYQFQPGTWAQVAQANPSLGLTPQGITDPAQQERAVRALTEANRASLGPQANDQNLYLAHFLGAEGANKFLAGMQANPNGPAAGLASPAAVRANQGAFFAPDGKPRSAQEFYGTLTGRFAPQQAPQQGAPQQGQTPQQQMDPMQLLRAGLMLQANPATAAVGQSLVSMATELVKENKPSIVKIGMDQNGIEQYAKFNPATGKLDPISAGQGASPTPGLTGEEFLKGMDPERAKVIRALVEGRMSPPQLGRAGTPQVMSLIRDANQYDPEYDATNWQGRQKAVSSFMGGQDADKVRAINQAILHGNSLTKSADALGNSRFPLVNTAKNMIASGVGSGTPAAFSLNAHAFAEELAKVFRGTGALSDQEVHAWEASISPSMSPDQQRQVIAKGIELLHGGIQALEEKRTAGVGSIMAGKMGPLIKPSQVKALEEIDAWASGKPKANGPTFQGNPIIRDAASYEKLSPGSVYVDGRDGQTKTKGGQ